MLYRLSSNGNYGKPDYYRLGESLRSDVLGGAEIALKRFVPELKMKAKNFEKTRLNERRGELLGGLV